MVCAALAAATPKPAQGHGEDESVAIEATVLTPDQVTEAVGSDFGGAYAVLEIRIKPKAGKPYAVRPDDFILRSESSGEHSGPLLAGQVAGAGEMVVKRTYAARPNPESPAMVSGMKVEMKDDLGGDDHLDAVKKKMLAEQTTSEPEAGLLFFPLAKEKPKSLVLSCTTPAGKLRIQFK